jgi:hypothetical protein
MRINLCLTERNETQPQSTVNELSTEEWKVIIQKSFNAGIPQVIFMGGEPTLRADLIELLQFTESLGMVSGLLTGSPKLYQDAAFLEALLNCGLDHLILEVNPEQSDPSVELQNIFNQDLFTCIRFPVHRHSNLMDWAVKLMESGCNALNFYPAELDALDQAAHLNQALANKGILIEHDLPFPLPSQQTANPNQLFSPEISTSELEYFTILPDGSLCNQENPNEKIGNLISTDWHELVVK